MRRTILFGKLPAHGDFVARGLAGDARDALDGWLAASLAAARAALGEAFDDSYDAAPPWRFAWTGAEGWTAGAMAPSMDAVGRRYPLLLGVDGLADTQVAPASEAAEALLYDGLAGGWDADRLAAAPAEPAPAARWEGGECWWTLGGGEAQGRGFVAARLAGARPAGLMRAMLTIEDDDA